MEKLNQEPTQHEITKIREALGIFNIDYSEWGTGGSKTVEHLCREVENGECKLVGVNCELVRIVETAAAYIFYFGSGGKVYQLVEDRQVFNDGHEIICGNDGRSVYEKMKLGEHPDDAIKRGIFEELGIDGDVELTNLGSESLESESDSYPGLKTHHDFYNYSVVLNEKQFNSRGYIEEQPDKVTYFSWSEYNKSDA